MQITLIILGIVGTVFLGLAGYLISANHKSFSVWSLFTSLVIYSLTACLYLQDYFWREESKNSQPRTESITPKELSIEQRPNIIVNYGQLETPLSSGNPPIAKFIFKNTGQTPALNVRVTAKAKLLNKQEQKLAEEGIMPAVSLDPSESTGAGTFGAGDTGRFSTGRLEHQNAKFKKMTTNGTFVFYAWGEILYSDNVGKEHYSKFCFRSEDVNSRDFNFCAKGNDAN